MNNVQLYGRLVKDPEVRFTEKCLAITRFTLAVNRPIKKGEQKEADFISCVAFGKTAENIGNHLRKGNACIVLGSIRTGSYQDKSGKTVYTTDILVNNFEFADSRRGGNNTSSNSGSNGSAENGGGTFESMGTSQPFIDDLEF